MGHLNLKIFQDEHASREAFASSVSEELSRLKSENIPVLLLVSGGSTLAASSNIDTACFGPHITIAVVDERYDPNGGCGNFDALTRIQWYDTAIQSGSRCIDTRYREGINREQLTDFFESELRRFRGEYPSGVIIALLGIGPDGHIAGIFPSKNQEMFKDLFAGDKWVAGYRAPEYAACPERVTTTMTFLATELHMAFAFFSGNEKREALKRLLANTDPIHLLPARVLYDIPAIIYTDKSTE